LNGNSLGNQGNKFRQFMLQYTCRSIYVIKTLLNKLEMDV